MLIMTVAELLVLPAGQRLRWEEWGLDGVITAAGGGGLAIHFSNGWETPLLPLASRMSPLSSPKPTKR